MARESIQTVPVQDLIEEVAFEDHAHRLVNGSFSDQDLSMAAFANLP